MTASSGGYTRIHAIRNFPNKAAANRFDISILAFACARASAVAECGVALCVTMIAPPIAAPVATEPAPPRGSLQARLTLRLRVRRPAARGRWRGSTGSDRIHDRAADLRPRVPNAHRTPAQEPKTSHSHGRCERMAAATSWQSSRVHGVVALPRSRLKTAL